ncbi:MAG: HlyD family efflux transporter periplasmic adaptor subunit [Candidatus Cloacimonetes bacterium]|nr:HlyD family efflux transporter periplasmic adaptor subunit [Candidatus Cloacimonadota bacterium]
MKAIYVLMLIALLAGCTSKDNSDAWGNFEAEETVLSARIAGNIIEMYVQEGDTVQAGELIAVTDTTDLALSRSELQDNIRLLQLKQKAANEKLQLGLTEKGNLQIEQQRFEKLLLQNATTQKQVDDINANLRLKEQSLKLNNTEIQMAGSEINIAQTKLQTINANIAKCYLKAPYEATVLSTYAGKAEFVPSGKPIVKLADMKNLKVVFYISGSQLTSVKVGKEITVRIDGAKNLETYPAKISYISSKAEFTPKVIQTREERTKLVYRVEAICVSNGNLKLGMPAEIVF